MKFSQQLKVLTKDSWEKSLNHPFVQGIVKGTLALDKFRFYILQDTYYLKHYGKVHALAAAKADDFSVTAMLAEKAKLTAEAEITVHKQHAQLLDITPEEMENFKPAPTAYAYTSHMYRACLLGDLAEVVAAMLPCYWLYADIGYANAKAKPGKKVYQNWIDTYASDWFQQSTKEQIDLLDELMEDANEQKKTRVTEQFVIAKEYELHFWEMAYTQETWLSNSKARLDY